MAPALILFHDGANTAGSGTSGDGPFFHHQYKFNRPLKSAVMAILNWR
jgi:hypothetical protein